MELNPFYQVEGKGGEPLDWKEGSRRLRTRPAQRAGRQLRPCSLCTRRDTRGGACSASLLKSPPGRTPASRAPPGRAAVRSVVALRLSLRTPPGGGAPVREPRRVGLGLRRFRGKPGETRRPPSPCAVVALPAGGLWTIHPPAPPCQGGERDKQDEAPFSGVTKTGVLLPENWKASAPLRIAGIAPSGSKTGILCN